MQTHNNKQSQTIISTVYTLTRDMQITDQACQRNGWHNIINILDQFWQAADVVKNARLETLGNAKYSHQITFQVQWENLA